MNANILQLQQQQLQQQQQQHQRSEDDQNEQAVTSTDAQQYQNQEEILAEQQIRQQQLQLQQQQQQAENGGYENPSAPLLSEAELMQLNGGNNVVVQQQQQQNPHQLMTEDQRQRYQSHLQLQLNQISAANAMGMQQFLHQAADNMINIQARQHEPMKYHRNFVDGDFEFVSGKVGFCFFYLLNNLCVLCS